MFGSNRLTDRSKDIEPSSVFFRIVEQTVIDMFVMEKTVLVMEILKVL